MLASIALGSLFAMRNDLSVVEALATCAIVFILIVWLPKVLLNVGTAGSG